MQCKTLKCGGTMVEKGGGVDKVVPDGPTFSFRTYQCPRCKRTAAKKVPQTLDYLIRDANIAVSSR